MRHLIFLVLLYTMSGMNSTAQSPPFEKGVNLTNWFQVDHPGAIHFGKYSKVDFENIASLGCDVIRLPFNLHAMTSGAPDYTLDPLFLGFLDSAVAWAEELDLHLILDNHTFEPSDNTEPSIEDPLVKVWSQMAQYYHGGFGIFKKGEQGLFDHNLNTSMLEQLGLNIPPQTSYEMKPNTTGFVIYDDYIHSQLKESSYGEGNINYYSSLSPNYGKYCIEWSDPGEFNIIGLDFQPDKYLSGLVKAGYFLDFFARASAPGLQLDVRFLDTDTGDDDHPWRNRFTIQINPDEMGNGWQYFSIPLKDFTEQGAWEGQWYNPEGKFNWAGIDRFEIATKDQSYPGNSIWIDQVVITNQDTASIITSTPGLGANKANLKLYPNPCTSRIVVEVDQYSGPYEIKIYSVLGALLHESTLQQFTQWIDTSHWPHGVYFLTLMGDGKFPVVNEFVKN